MAGYSFITLSMVFLLVRTTGANCTLRKMNTGNYLCKNITKLPKNIPPNATALQFENCILDGSEFENIIVPPQVTKIEIFKTVLKELDFGKLNLPSSIKIFLIESSKIKRIGAFKKNNLEHLQIAGNENLVIEPGAFDRLSKLLHLSLPRNKLDNVPVFNSRLNELYELDLRSNHIKELKSIQLLNLPSLEKLHLSYNKFNCLPNNMFQSNNIKEIDWSYNPITRIDSNAFANLTRLETLSLNGTDIERLPTEGLRNLKTLNLERAHNLRTIPGRFTRTLKKVTLAKEKSFLCCKLKFERVQGLTGPVTLTPQQSYHGYKTTIIVTATPYGSTLPTTHGNRSTRSAIDTLPAGFGRRRKRSRVITQPPGSKPNISDPVVPPEPPKPFICTPEPTAFQPCEDIMGTPWLTGVSFIVAPFAVCGNFVVIVVFLCMARNYNVSRFLVTNLAIADMSMGIYLMSLVIESVITSGEYYEHVERFQFGLSCKVLGFLAMFSSELSVFSLTLITVERYLTIVYAMYPKRRLTMRTALFCMAIGWAIAFTVGLLPILGVGSFGKVAICLPFDTSNGGDLYLIIVFGLNSVSFLFICALYTQIYKSVFRTNNSTPTRGHDSRVARRMALLIFTDFACFAPLAVTGLSALLGNPLVNVTQSKYLLVFFFPLNGLLNPFLYAIITKTFRRDLAALLKNCFVCGGTLTNYLSTFPARSVQSTNDVLSRSARPSFDMNAMDFRHSWGNIRGSRENPVSASFSRSEPNLVRFSQEALNT